MQILNFTHVLSFISCFQLIFELQSCTLAHTDWMRTNWELGLTFRCSFRSSCEVQRLVQGHFELESRMKHIWPSYHRLHHSTGTGSGSPHDPWLVIGADNRRWMDRYELWANKAADGESLLKLCWMQIIKYNKKSVFYVMFWHLSELHQ